MNQHEKAHADFARAISNCEKTLAEHKATVGANRPATLDCMVTLASCYCDAGRYDKARVEFANALSAGVSSHDVRYYYALLCLKQDDRPAYRKACAGMVKQYSASQNQGELNSTAWSCVLAPSALDDYAPVLQIARRAVQREPKDQDNLETLGAALFRAGQLDEARKYLGDVNAPPSANTSPAYGWYFLAMTHHRLGNGREAQKLHKMAREYTAKVLAEGKQGDVQPLPWNRRLTLELLRDETQALLGGSEPATKKL